MEITANIPEQGAAHIQIIGERIESVRLIGPTQSNKPFVSPGFVDIQLNGFAGVNFSDPGLDPEEAISILPALWKTGVTTFCPTLITNSLDNLRKDFQVLEAARKLDAHFAQAAPCYHLEGPYLSRGESRGCHDPHLMRIPDWDEFISLQEAAGGNIAIVTLAPELPGAEEFIHRACAADLVVAVGHTDATPEQIHRAVEAGATLGTHLGNGCPQFIHRHQNPLWAQLASDQLQASLICDGFHLPPDFVRVVLGLKGIERCILITDAVHVAMQPPGRYSLVGQEIELLPTGQIVTSDQRCMAGSALTMNRAIPIFMDYARVSLAHALRAATNNPARLLGNQKVCARLDSGQPANLVLFRERTGSLDIVKVTLRGEVVYTSSETAPADVHGDEK